MPATHRTEGAPVVLVTGALGFTGRHVIDALRSADFDVVAWGHAEGEGVRAVDLRDRAAVAAALEGVSARVVVHLAAISFVAHQDVANIYQTNIVGARNLLSALADGESPLSVVLASSANVYGNVEGSLDESVPPQPMNDYAISKLAMEQIVNMFRDAFPVSIMRPFNYTGVGQSDRFLVPKIVSHFRQKRPRIELGNLHVRREFNDVRDVADAYVRLAKSPPPPGIYNVCSGIEYSLTDVIKEMERLSGHRIEVDVNPAFVRRNEVESLRGDPRKLVDTTGWQPRHRLSDTLRWMYEHE